MENDNLNPDPQENSDASQKPEEKSSINPEEDEDIKYADAYIRSLQKPKPKIVTVIKKIPYFKPRFKQETITQIKKVYVPIDGPENSKQSPAKKSLDTAVRESEKKSCADTGDSFPEFPSDASANKNSGNAETPEMPVIEVKDPPAAKAKNIIRPSGNLFTPTLYDLTSYFKLPFIKNNRPMMIKNEEDVSLLISLAYIQKISFGIEGYAGSAKTDLMDLLLKLVNCDDKFYILTSASDKSLYYDQKEINSKSWFYVTEMQKCMNLVEIWKSLAEGKEATHRVKLGNNLMKIVLAPKPVCFTKAYDNRWELDRELRRRFMIVDSTTTPDENEEIVKDIFSNCHKVLKATNKEQDLVDSLKTHLERLYQKQDLLYFDPYADCLAEVLPTRNKRVKSYVNHYLGLLQACAKFHLDERTQFKHGNKTYVVLNLADHLNVFRAYHADFTNVLKHFDDENADDFTPYETVKVDWEKWAKAGLDLMKNHEDAKIIRKVAPDFVDKWQSKQEKSGAMYVLDYKTGNDIKIADAPQNGP